MYRLLLENKYIDDVLQIIHLTKIHAIENMRFDRYRCFLRYLERFEFILYLYLICVRMSRTSKFEGMFIRR